ncbi:MAG: potassium/proton antiporter [Bacteroidales bacterium]|nr:potassium/proton antiporter [Bacteroidales bacterium]
MIPLSIFDVNLMSGNLLLLCSILIFVAIMVTKLGSRFGVPSLLLFLLLGMAAGADGLGLQFEEYEVAESIGHFAMTVILLTAGLETSLAETRPVIKHGTVLSTFGVLLTVLLTGLFIFFALGNMIGLPVLGCLLLAAVMGSTDSASVFSILRDKKMKLRENLAPMLELESGSNDPMAYTLTIILVKMLSSDGLLYYSGLQLALNALFILLIQIIVGVVVGFAVGYAAKWVLDRVRLPGFALTAILILSVGFFANGIASLFNGNGLLSLYIAAIIIGNKAQLSHRKEIITFMDGLTWLMQLVMFLVLGLLARPSQMLPVLLPAILIGLFMMFVARPLSVFTCLLPFRDLSARAKLLTSWVGLKGAGPILFALYPVVVGYESSSDIFNIVFIITLFSLSLQGTTLGSFAKLLKLCYPETPKVETFGIEVPEVMGMLRDHTVTEDDLAGGETLRDLHLPHGIRVMMVRRDDKFLVPHGSMPLMVGDKLVIIMGDSDDD